MKPFDDAHKNITELAFWL